MSRALPLALAAALLLSGCVSRIPPDSYGVERLTIEGMHDLDPAAVRACLATGQRERFGFDLGTSSDLTCGQPPFDGNRVGVHPWAWSWTDWPVFDASVFERDLERIERWFRARGYYDATVERAEFSPPSAGVTDEIPEAGDAPCERRSEREGCALEITVHVREGDPVRVRSRVIEGLESLPPAIRRRVESTSMPRVGDRWDEAAHDDAKEAILETLREQSYACALIEARVDLDPEAKTADIHYRVLPGPPSTFGNVTVEVEGDATHIPINTVRAVTGIDRGEAYAPSKLSSAQSAVYGLGAFGAVEVVASPRTHPEQVVSAVDAPPPSAAEDLDATFTNDPGTPEPEAPAVRTRSSTRTVCDGVVDVSVRVSPGRRIRWGIGAGMQSGRINTGGTAATQSSQPIWDVHLISFVEHRNFLGGLRRIRLEERPKLVFQDVFPAPVNPRPGNEVRLDFRQPAFIERRTTLLVNGRSDLGPDPYTYVRRHALDASIGVRRPFWQERILVGVSFHASQYHPIEQPADVTVGTDPVTGKPITAPSNRITPNNHALFMEEYVQLDLRDDSRDPRRGALISVDFQQSGVAGLSSWTYYRVVPDARFYIPLPWRMVLAGRFGLGMMFITGTKGMGPKDGGYDPYEATRVLGPPQFRIRGGGPNDNRGFTAAQLGDYEGNVNPSFEPVDGGLRKWIGSLELRTHLTESFGIVAFADVGDVNRGQPDANGLLYHAGFRFNRPNLTLGLGLRYHTIVGPIRFDMGWRVPGAQGGTGTDPVTGATRNCSLYDPVIGCAPPTSVLNWFPGAIQLTIGEAF